MGIALDSNILIRYFAKDNEKLLKKAIKIIDKAGPGSLVIDRIVIAEVGYVLRSVYGFKKDGLLLTYRSIMSNGACMITDRELTKLTIDLFETEKPLSFEDCWLLALKQSGKVQSVATFDSDLAKRL